VPVSWSDARLQEELEDRVEGVVSVALRHAKNDPAALPGGNLVFASEQHSADAIEVLHGLPVGDGLALSVRLPGKLLPPAHAVLVRGVPKGQRWERLFSMFALALNEHTPGQGKHIMSVLGMGNPNRPTTVAVSSARIARLTAKLLDGASFAGATLSVVVANNSAAPARQPAAATVTKRTSSGVVVHKRAAPPSEPPSQPPSLDPHRNVRVTINRAGGAKRSRAEFVSSESGYSAGGSSGHRYGQVHDNHGQGPDSGAGRGGYSGDNQHQGRYQGGGYQGRSGPPKQRRHD